MHFLGSRMHLRSGFAVRDLPWTPLGDLTCSPRPPSRWRGGSLPLPRIPPCSRPSASNFGPSGLRIECPSSLKTTGYAHAQSSLRPFRTSKLNYGSAAEIWTYEWRLLETGRRAAPAARRTSLGWRSEPYDRRHTAVLRLVKLPGLHVVSSEDVQVVNRPSTAHRVYRPRSTAAGPQ